MAEDFDYDLKHYDYLFRNWLQNVESYWKRVQFLMVGIQTVLFFGFVGLVSHYEEAKVWILCISVVGMIAALYWRSTASRAMDYMEFYRCYMRDLEKKMCHRINCFTVESKVFGPEKEQHHFEHSGEKFPYPEDKKGPHYRCKVKGGLAPMERNLAWVFFGWWLAILVVVFFK